MEYPGDAFHTFLDLDSGIYLAVNGTVTSLPVFIQNILNCVPKTNKVLLVRNDMGWVKNDYILILGWSIPLREQLACMNETASLISVLQI